MQWWQGSGFDSLCCHMFLPFFFMHFLMFNFALYLSVLLKLRALLQNVTNALG